MTKSWLKCLRSCSSMSHMHVENERSAVILLLVSAGWITLNWSSSAKIKQQTSGWRNICVTELLNRPQEEHRGADRSITWPWLHHCTAPCSSCSQPIRTRHTHYISEEWWSRIYELQPHEQNRISADQRRNKEALSHCWTWLHVYEETLISFSSSLQQDSQLGHFIPHHLRHLYRNNTFSHHTTSTAFHSRSRRGSDTERGINQAGKHFTLISRTDHKGHGTFVSPSVCRFYSLSLCPSCFLFLFLLVSQFLTFLSLLFPPHIFTEHIMGCMWHTLLLVSL